MTPMYDFLSYFDSFHLVSVSKYRLVKNNESISS